LTADQLAAAFTLDPSETPIQVVSWGRLGDTWPYFRPNFTNMEEARRQAGAQQVDGYNSLDSDNDRPHVTPLTVTMTGHMG